VPAGTARCNTHRRAPWQRDGRPSATSRGYGGPWKRLRLQILERDPICLICGQAAATSVDHATPKFLGGTDDPENLRGVCEQCQRRKAGAEGKQARQMRERRS
jgi:5-methylcytosine-specific restriction protein A